jgi:hypothetical protein
MHEAYVSCRGRAWQPQQLQRACGTRQLQHGSGEVMHAFRLAALARRCCPWQHRLQSHTGRAYWSVYAWFAPQFLAAGYTCIACRLLACPRLASHAGCCNIPTRCCTDEFWLMPILRPPVDSAVQAAGLAACLRFACSIQLHRSGCCSCCCRVRALWLVS